MTIRVRSLTDPHERHAAIPALSDLRIRIFRAWPYLYDGTADYEAAYLAEFIREPGAVLIVAHDGDAVVGAATASPMAGQKPEFQLPLRAHGMDVARIFYFGSRFCSPIITDRVSAINFSTRVRRRHGPQARFKPAFVP